MDKTHTHSHTYTLSLFTAFKNIQSIMGEALFGDPLQWKHQNEGKEEEENHGNQSMYYIL
jgi:hypothetical protein